jgi:hypothetical protein
VRRGETNKTRRKDALIASRNKQVANSIGENYRKDTGDDAGATTYCVSNRMYMRHIRGYDKTDQSKVPSMTLEDTQIPALCSHIYALPSKGKTADLDHWARVSIPMLFSIMQTSCSTTTIARVNHLVSIIRKARGVIFSTRHLFVKTSPTDACSCSGQGSAISLQNSAVRISKLFTISCQTTPCKPGLTEML